MKLTLGKSDNPYIDEEAIIKDFSEIVIKSEDGNNYKLFKGILPQSKTDHIDNLNGLSKELKTIYICFGIDLESVLKSSLENGKIKKQDIDLDTPDANDDVIDPVNENDNDLFADDNDEDIKEDFSAKVETKVEIIDIEDSDHFSCSECEKVFKDQNELDFHLKWRWRWKICNVPISKTMSNDAQNQDIFASVKNEPNDQDQILAEDQPLKKPSKSTANITNKLKKLSSISITSAKSSASPWAGQVSQRPKANKVPMPAIPSKQYATNTRYPLVRKRPSVTPKKDYVGEFLAKRQVKASCDVCGIAFVSVSELEKHAKRHEKKEPNTQKVVKKTSKVWSCEICKEKFDKQAHFMRHMTSSHKDKDCPECGQSFKYLVELRTHREAMHGVEREAYKGRVDSICDQCGKVMANQTALKRHVDREHGPDEKIPCKECGRVYRNQAAMNHHIKISHDLSPCTVCAQMIPAYKMNRHMIVWHTDDKLKPFICEICKKGFCNKTRFDKHKVVHTGEKPYVCHCGSRFGHSQNLSAHQQSVHMGMKRKPRK